MPIFKKVGIVTLFVAAGLGAFLLGQRVIAGMSSTSQTAQIQNTLTDRFNPKTEKYVIPDTPIQLTNDEARSPIMTSDNNFMYYYYPLRGEIRKISLSDARHPASSLVAKIDIGAQNLSWSRDQSAVIANYTKGSVYYNLARNTSKRYDPDVINPVFARTSDFIAYEQYDAKQNIGSINIADPLLNASKQIMATRSNKWRIAWDGGIYITLIHKVAGSVALYSLYSLDTETKRFIKDLDRIENLEMLWSPDNSSALISSTESGQDTLSVIYTANDVITNLHLKTKSSKCGWSADSTLIYCGVTQTSGTDSLIRMRLADQSVTILYQAQNTQRIDMRSLFVKNLGDLLVFTNAVNGKLYSFAITQPE